MIRLSAQYPPADLHLLSCTVYYCENKATDNTAIIYLEVRALGLFLAGELLQY